MHQANEASSPQSTVSDDSVIQPQTPISGEGNSNSTLSSSSSSATGKRKSSRRASTAERRATHNAVERARRETLNGRFLDLAALLPNLSQLRRPSKSAIVNSSIAHIHAARRHRLLASRELRLLKLESDALRREINEWRNRAGIPRIEEPVRGEGFSTVLSGEQEVIPVPTGAQDQDDEDEDGIIVEEQQQPPMMMRSSPVHSMSAPIIASPTAMSFEDPVLGRMYDTIPANDPAGYPHQGGAYDPAMKWGAYPHHVDQQAYYRRSRSSSQSSGASASPPSAYYDQAPVPVGWNTRGMINSGNMNMNMNNMNMNMAMNANMAMPIGNMGNMGMASGGGSTMGNGAFAMMM
jgi:hypothetical protein